MWIKIPSLSDGYVVYMCYGDSGLTTDGSSTSTWSLFKGVFHIEDVTGSTDSVPDSTSNNWDMTPHGSPTNTTGKIGGAGSFSSGSSQYTDTSTSVSITAALTFTAWINCPSMAANGGYNPILDKGDFTGGAWANLSYQFDMGSSGKFTGYFYNGNNNEYKGRPSSSTLSDNTWHQVGFTWAGGGANPDIYTDGALDNGTLDENGGITTLNNTSVSLDIGRTRSSSSSAYTTCKVDEIHLMDDDMSADWIATEYNNGTMGSFWGIGSENTPGGGGGPAPRVIGGGII
jgi:hypothetical protein